MPLRPPLAPIGLRRMDTVSAARVHRLRACRGRPLAWNAAGSFPGQAFFSGPLGMLFSLPLRKWRSAPMLFAPQFLDLLPQLLVLALQLADQPDEFASIHRLQIRHKTLSPDFVCNARAIKSRCSRTAPAFRLSSTFQASRQARARWRVGLVRSSRRAHHYPATKSNGADGHRESFHRRIFWCPRGFASATAIGL